MFYYPDCGIITSRARVVMSPVRRAMAVSPLKFVSMEFRTDKKFNSGTDPPPVIHSTVTAGRWWWRAYLVGSTRATDIHDPTILHPPFSTLPLPSSSIHHLTTSRAHHYLNVWTANRQSQHWSSKGEGKYFIFSIGIHNLLVEKFRTFDLYVFRCNMFRNPLLECQMHRAQGVSFVAHSYSTYYLATGCGLPRCELNWWVRHALL